MTEGSGVVRIGDVRLSDRAGARRIPLGDDGFERAASRSVLVDKTMLVADLLEAGDAVTLFCRPRRFGKTLNMSMLRAFFEIPSESDPNARDLAPLFEGLSIWDAAGGAYRKHQGAYPVIFVSLNTVKRATWGESRDAIAELMAVEYTRHAYLASSPRLTEEQKAFFGRIAARRGDPTDLAASLTRLASFLYAHHGRRVVLLIDEYDAPIMAGYSSKTPYYDEVVGFVKGWLTGALKDAGAALAFACLTGVQRISKESIFSDLNNLTVSTPLGSQFDERFGFTDAEVAALAEYLGHAGHMDELRAWYDGYRFGGANIYNPWSVLSYFANNCEPGTYWVNTSNNSVIGEAVRRSDEMTLSSLYHLMELGATVPVRLNLEMVLPDVGMRGDALWGMLYLAGYVTTDETARPNMRSMVRRLRLPNMEVSALFRDEIIERFSASAGGEQGLDLLHRGLFEGDADLVERELNRILLNATSFHDLTSENSYHMLMLGLCFGLNGYMNPTSNREAGEGRFDIRIEPAAPSSPFAALTLSMPQRPPLITIEVKRLRGESSQDDSALRGLAQAALRQISERGYDAGVLPTAACGRVRFGIAFAGKHACVAGERVK